MQQVHFCSGSVFVTGDAIAMSLLHYVQTVAAARRSDVVTVPTMSETGTAGAVTLMINGVSQISSDSLGHDGPELEDDAFVTGLDARARRLSTATVWLGEDDLTAA